MSSIKEWDMHNKNLWAPWRLPYLLALGEDIEQEKKELGMLDGDDSGGCFLQDYWLHPEDDATNLVIFRNESGMILLNRYPYSNGHVLVALGEGRPCLRDYDKEQRAALWLLVERGCELMDLALNPQGKNIGINEGHAAGAGIPEHLHVHIVPRWSGDTNFITVVGEVRVVPSALDAMYEQFMRVV